jgi:hypothetical protein
MSDDGIPWLTDADRNLLAHLCTLTIQAQLQPARSYQRVSEALGDLADAGEVLLRADDANVYVLVHGAVIVHAERDWLQYHSRLEAARPMN